MIDGIGIGLEECNYNGTDVMHYINTTIDGGTDTNIEFFDTIAVINESTVCDNLVTPLIEFAQKSGARAVLLVNANTTQNLNSISYIYDFVALNLSIIINNDHNYLSNNWTHSLVYSLQALVGLECFTYIVQIINITTINTQVKCEVRRSYQTYAYLQDLSFQHMIEAGLNYLVNVNISDNSHIDGMLIAVNWIKIQTDFEISQTPAPAPTNDYLYNNVNINIPVQMVHITAPMTDESITFLQQLSVTDPARMVFSCLSILDIIPTAHPTQYPSISPTKIIINETATASPTQQPTTEPTLFGTSDYFEIGFWTNNLKRLEFSLQFNYYEYYDDEVQNNAPIFEQCLGHSLTPSEVFFAAFDTVYTIPDFMCVVFGSWTLAIEDIDLNETTYTLSRSSYEVSDCFNNYATAYALGMF